MKRFLFRTALIAACTSMIASQIVFADVLPENTKTITTCATITGISGLTNYIVYARESGPTTETKIWTPVEGDCLDVGYKFNSLDLYAIAKNLPQDSDPSTNVNAYKSNVKLNMDDLWVSPTSKLTYQHNKYRITGLDYPNHALAVSVEGFNTNLTTAEFLDVPKGSMYFDASIYLKNTGIIAGYADGKFKPYNRINRAEFSQIMANVDSGYPFHYALCMEDYANADGSYKNLFTDVITKDNPWYLNAVCYAKASNFVKGYPDGSFHPEAEINYAEAATILTHVFKVHTAVLADGRAWYAIYTDALEKLGVVPTEIKTPDQKITRGDMIYIIYQLQQKLGNYPAN